ncbi:ISAs1 family transposase [Pectobacterium sp. A535-S3-A17]|uniref:ISAs1 family transposase n=1 Tax=Pectobacterium quasiaquaticum TaxID=2774015 RepID=A0A9Q8TRL2_9GAMM|nr:MULTISPECIES: ISAs1 family transposase [Pectobacterium]MBE5216023.1 ISAs1 family transposase [Pectobacterium quasiaquaticum]MBE5220593.1 ISAs1 family transposase [Pectobacterium quasiaquaticum]MBE5227568.1 ISAs1 family transposase [Pectobacterium quasiaquaticum]MBN3063433.1 ISAs1 family transposase [Pectobacterium aquaticum]URG49532.1 ISAs1 family transposase [Pectobacterium quasiaquaticum]
MSFDTFTHYFSDIQEPRQSAKISYPLIDILFLTLCAVIAGCDGWEDIEDFGEARLDWLQSHGFFTLGLPVHDTIARVISQIDAAQLQRSFIQWVQSVSIKTDGKVVAIDGKTVRRSYNRDSRRSAIHMVSAFATANGVVMGQVKTDSKSNEITAIPELLSLLELKGCLVTLDAMGCQKKIAEAIVAKEADYLLAVKGNHPVLHEALKQALRPPLQQISNENIVIEQGHGRTECREYHVLDASELKEGVAEWPQLNTIGVAVSYRIEKNKKESLEYRYYISSAKLSNEEFAAAVRGHWRIENQLHWVLDVAMREDAIAIYRGNAAENLASIRHISLNMIRQEKGKKASVPRKRRMAAMKMDYLEAILLAGLGMNK